MLAQNGLKVSYEAGSLFHFLGPRWGAALISLLRYAKVTFQLDCIAEVTFLLSYSNILPLGPKPDLIIYCI